MQSIVFNFFQSHLNQKVEAITLKAGYLLSNEVCTAGTTCHDIYISENISDQSLFGKLDFLEHMSMSQNHSKFLKEVRKMRTLMNKMYGKSCITAKQRISRQEGEELIDITYKSFLQSYEDVISSYGFQQLKELAEDDSFLFYPMNKNPEDPSGDRIIASHLLQRLLFTIDNNEPDDDEQDAEPEIFLLGTEFLTDNYSKPKIYKATDAEARCNDTIYLHRAFTLNGIHRLATDELRTVRNDILQAGSLFHQNMNEWIDMCYFNDSLSERLSFFNTQVAPAAAGLQKEIESNRILNNHAWAEDDTLQTEVWLGEMPVSQLWKYYRDHNVIKDSTWRKLQQGKALQNERWPVMMLSVPDIQLQQYLTKESNQEEEEFVEEMTEEPVEEIKPTKKYLLID